MGVGSGVGGSGARLPLTAYTIPRLAKAECISQTMSVYEGCYMLSLASTIWASTHIRIILVKVFECCFKLLKLCGGQVGMCCGYHLSGSTPAL